MACWNDNSLYTMIYSIVNQGNLNQLWWVLIYHWHCHIRIKWWHSGGFKFAGYHATRVHISRWTKSLQILMHREMCPFVKCCLLSCRVVWITYNFWHVAKHEFVVKCKLTTSSLSGATRFFCDESSMVALGTLDSSVPVGLISDVFSGGKSIWEC